jgi:manganese/zinc/iron transport system permease protein
MLRQDAIVILAGGALALALVWVMRRPMTLVSFDPDLRRRPDTTSTHRPDDAGRPCRHGDRTEGRGARPDRRAVDHSAGRGAVLDRQVGRMIWISGAYRRRRRDMSARRFRPPRRTFRPGRSSSSCAAAIFSFPLLFAPVRGLAAAVWRQSHFKARVHQRQGLLALARQEPIREAYTLRLLQRRA